MKKLLMGLFITASIFACKNQDSNNSNLESNSNGKPSNTEIVREINDDLVSYNFEKLQSHYNDSTLVHDNLKVETIGKNLQGFIPLKNAGVKFTIEGNPMIYEVINNKQDTLNGGYPSYVFTYITFSASKAGVKKIFKCSQIFGMKDGKVLEEWDTYDTVPVMELMKN